MLLLRPGAHWSHECVSIRISRSAEPAKPSRRQFITWATAGGIALSLSRLASAQPVDFAVRETLPGRQGWNPAANGAGRIDGIAKVTGTKLYASDFRAADIPGWPSNTSHALLIRAADATHVYEGLDLSSLDAKLKPSVVVTAADLEKAGTRVPEFYAGDLFCPIGKTPLYLGQPVALLIFERFDIFDQARLVLRDANVIKFGKDTGPVEKAELRLLSFYACCRSDADFAGCLFPDPGRLGQPGLFPK